MEIKSILFALLTTIVVSNQSVNAQSDEKYPNKLSVLAGLIQPVVLGGGNIEATFFTKKTQL